MALRSTRRIKPLSTFLPGSGERIRCQNDQNKLATTARSNKIIMNFNIMDSKPVSAKQSNESSQHNDSKENMGRSFQFRCLNEEWNLEIHPAYWIISACIIAITVSLGLWQLDRKSQKEVIIDQQAQIEIQSFKLSGHFLPDIIYLENITHQGKSGYEIIQTFQPESSILRQNEAETKALLVNRGWVDAPAHRSKLPIVPTIKKAHTIELTPEVWSSRTPKHNIERFVKTNANDQRQAIRIQALNEITQKELKLPDQYYRLISGDSKLVTDHWKARQDSLTISPNKHLGYAIQWFLIALVALIVLLTSSVKKSTPNALKSNGI